MITGKSPPNPLPCGCGIKGTPYIAMYGSNCDLRQEYRNQFIEFCPLHSAAPLLLEACMAMIAPHQTPETYEAALGLAHSAIRAAGGAV